MPVVTPSFASIETIAESPREDWLPRLPICSRPSSTQRSVESATQTRPRASVAMKLTAAESANSAAISRSPSPWRSQSSRSRTMRPAASSSPASGDRIPDQVEAHHHAASHSVGAVAVTGRSSVGSGISSVSPVRTILRATAPE